MKRLFIGFLICLVGCAHDRTHVGTLDGKKTVIEGRWNGMSKSEAQILVLASPMIIEVRDIGPRLTPMQNEVIRVTAVLHWRSESQHKVIIGDTPEQIPPAGYFLDWREAIWKGVDKKHSEPNQSSEPMAGLRPSMAHL